MKKIILPFLLSFQFHVYAQLVFEVNEPLQIANVYPCIAPDQNWNIPDLNQNGNWYVDTVIVANDGSVSQACNPLLSNVYGQFAIFKREYCDIGQALMNVQNAGATGALIIDTIAGRPLPFTDSVYSGVTIPFIIISKDIGDSIISNLSNGTLCTVSFGDKTGTSNIDLGIYKETSWWSMYGAFPFDNFNLPDSTWGTWIYNHGTDTAYNVGLNFYFEWFENSLTNIHDTTLSSLTVFPQDSLYVAFEFNPPINPFSYSYNDTLYYGYKLLYTDNDSLDNNAENFIVGTLNYMSVTHDWDIYNTMDSPDFTFTEEVYDTVSQRFGITKSDPNNGYLGVVSLNKTTDGLPPDMYSVHPGDSIYTYSQIPYDHVLYSNYFLNYGNNDIYESECFDLDHMFNNGYSILSRFDIILDNWYESDSIKIQCSTDMYHDMRRKSDSTFLVIMLYYLDSTGWHDRYVFPDSRITPNQLLYLNFHEGPDCGGGIEELTTKVLLQPNPTSNTLDIICDFPINDYFIIGLNGEILKSQQSISNKELRIDISDLQSGIYIIKVQSESGETFNTRLIKS